MGVLRRRTAKRRRSVHRAYIRCTGDGLHQRAGVLWAYNAGVRRSVDGAYTGRVNVKGKVKVKFLRALCQTEDFFRAIRLRFGLVSVFWGFHETASVSVVLNRRNLYPDVQ